LERLEDLTLLSTANSWTGAGHDGLWSDATNWSLGLPAAGQDVVITSAGNTTSVSLDNSLGDVTIDSLTTSVSFNLTSGAVLRTQGGGSVATGGVTLQGGAIASILGGSQLVVDGGVGINQSIAGSGAVTFDANADNAIGVTGQCTLTIGSGITVNGRNGTIKGLPGSFSTKLVNNGVVDANVPGGTVLITSLNSVTNVGTFQVSAGAELEVAAAFSNAGSSNNSTLFGGTYVVAGRLALPTSSIVQNDANITLDGSGAAIVNSVNGADALQGFLEQADGPVTLLHGFRFSGPASIGMALDSLTIDNTGVGFGQQATTLVASNLTVGSLTLVAGGVLDTYSGIGGIVTGNVQGSGSIYGAVINQATLSPGTATAPGQIFIKGNFLQNSPGVLSVKLGGTAVAGADYDQLVVSGSIYLAGTINVSEINGFVPQPGNAFQILPDGPISGDFTTKGGFSLGGGHELAEQIQPDSLTLTVVQQAEHLQFINQPATFANNAFDNTFTGKPIDAPEGLQVGVFDAEGNLITTDNSDQISITSNMISLTGGGPVTVVGGVATFDNLIINTSGAGYQLTAVAAGVNSARSGFFNVTPENQTTHLAFLTEPADATVGSTLSPFQVAFEDQNNKIETYDNFDAVFLDLARTNQTTDLQHIVSGTNPVVVHNGIATFSDLSILKPGTNYFFDAIMVNGATGGALFNVSATATTTVAANVSSTAGQTVTLQATVSDGNSAFPVNEGTVSFEVFNGATQIGSTVTSGTVADGTASAEFAIPGNAAPGAYIIKAVYTDTTGVSFASSQSDPGNNGSLIIPAATTTTAANASAPFGSNSQLVTLSATVASASTVVNEGTVTFSVFTAGDVQVGAAVTSGTVSSGNATAGFTLPAGQTLGTYSVRAVYNPGPSYLTSSDSAHILTIATAATSVAASNTSIPFSSASQSVTLSAAVTSAAGVDEGTVTFTVFAGGDVPIGSPVTSGVVTDGKATASFTVPAGEASGTFVIQAVYNPGPDYLGSADSTHTLSIGSAATATNASSFSTTFSPASRSVQLSAAVTSGGAGVSEGTVTFTVFSAANVQVGTPVTGNTVSAGNATASFTVPAGEPAGAYEIRAVYNPGPDYQGSSDTTHTLTVAKANTLTVAANVDAKFSPSSQSLTLSAAVTSGGGGLGEGTVTFTVLAAGNVQVGLPVTSATVSGGAASATFALPAGQKAGTYTIQAEYNPGGDYSVSSDFAHTLTVGPASTSTSATSVAAAFSASSQSVTLSADISSGGAGVNEGTVTFSVFSTDNTPVGQPVTSGAVSGGNASAAFTLPADEPAGGYEVKAVYNPGADYQGSSDSTHTLSVGKATVSVVASNAVAAFSPNEQTVTLSAAVNSGGAGVSEGTITFAVLTADNVQVGQKVMSSTVSMGNATAKFTLPAGQGLGTYTIQAVYNPGADYQGSADSTHALSVDPASTETVAIAAAVPFIPGNQSVTLSAIVVINGSGVNDGLEVNEGSVTFTLVSSTNQIIGTPKTSGTLVDGQGSVSYGLPAGLSAGSYKIEARYNPGPDYLGSVDSTNELVLEPAATTTAAAIATATFSTSSQSVTLSAAVTSGGTGVTEGTVTFSVLGAGNTLIGSPVTSNTLSAGNASASFTLPAGTAPGVYTVQAQYADATPGDFQSSIDNTHSLLVGFATSVTASSVSAPFSTSAQSVTLLATVSGGGSTINAGTVTFTVLDDHDHAVGSPVTSGTLTDGSASVTYALPAGTAAGSYVIQAQYSDGSPGLLLPSSDTSHSVTVQPAATATAASNTSTTFNTTAHKVSLSASVTSAVGTVSEGAVTVTILNGSVVIGSPVTSSIVNGGTASVNYSLPASLAPGSYTLLVQYNDAGGSFSGSDNSSSSGTFVVFPAAASADVNPVVVAANSAVEMVTLQATVISPAGPVSGGTVTFTVLQSGTPVGSTVTSTAVAAGTASAVYLLPAGTPAGSYTIQATYSGNGGFQSSSPVTNTFIVDAGPSFPPMNGTNTVSVPVGEFPQILPTNASSFAGSTLTYTASAVGDSALFDLQQKYQFTSVGMASTTLNGLTTTAFVVHSNFASGAGGYYLIRPGDGALFAYDGSGSYAHSFTATPIATLGPNVFADPTLLINALPPADYSALQALQQQYQFAAVGPAATTVSGATTHGFLLHSNRTGGTGFMGYYVIRSTDGAIFPYDGSGSFASTFNGTPLTTTLFGPNLFAYPQELVNAVAAPTLYNQLYQVNHQFDLQENGGFYANLFGNQAEWLYSPLLNQYGQHWYTLTLSGGQSVLRAWQGYQDSAVGNVVATFNTPAVYNNPLLLTTATYLPDPATVSVSPTGTLTIGLANDRFVGAFKVLVSVSDGVLSASQTLTVSSTDTAPTLTVTQNGVVVSAGSTLVVPHGVFPLSDPVSASGSQPVTITASVSSFNPLFNLQEQLRLRFLGNFVAGTAADVFAAAGLNKFGNPYYVLSPAGALYAYDGNNNYANSFGGPPVATLTPNVYQDPTLLTNAQPPVNYSQLNALQTQFQFAVAGPATAGATPVEALRSDQPGPGAMGYYLLTPNGNIYAYDGSSLATSISNSATIVATVDPGVFVNPALLINATVSPGMYPLLQQDEQKFDLQELPDGFHTGLMGNAAKWLFSPVPNSKSQHFDTLVLSANGSQALVYEWDGGTNSVPTGATPVAVLDASVYFDPTLLLNAKAPEAATGVTVNGGTSAVPVTTSLNLNAPSSFVGAFQVSVTTTDGAMTTSETFQVNATDIAPVPSTVPAQTTKVSNGPLVVSLSSIDAENDPVSYIATVASAPFALQQQYQFTGVGLITTNVGGVMTTAYVLQSSVPGGVGGFYLLKSDGGVYAYDGSGDYSTTFADGHNLVANLSSAVFTTPTLLTEATPTPPVAIVSVTGSNLSLKVTGVPPATLLEVFVTAFDGAETARTRFLVTVMP
jgi:hypothetical protein